MPRKSAVEQQLRGQPPPSIAGNDVMVQAGVTDSQNILKPPAMGEVVLSVPSPKTLAREGAEVRRVIAQAGTGIDPLVLVVEVAEELRDEELAAVLDAAAQTSRPVILRIVRDA